MDVEGAGSGSYGAVESPTKVVGPGGSGDGADKKLTPDQVADIVGFGTYHYVMFFVGAFCITCELLEVAFVGFLLTELKTEWHLSNIELTLLGSATFFGQLIGYFTAGIVGDRLGRKTGSLVFCCLLLLGAFGGDPHVCRQFQFPSSIVSST